MTVLIFSYPEDVHFKAVSKKLEERGVPYYLIDFTNPVLSDNISCQISNDAGYLLSLSAGRSRDLDIDSVTSVWFRRLENPMAFTDCPEEVVNPDNRYIKKENMSLVETFYHILKDRFWLPDMQNQFIASHKPIQLITAVKHGIRIPKTWLGNSPEGLEVFLESSDFPESCALKALRSSSYILAPSALKRQYIKLMNATVFRYTKKKLYLNPYRFSMTKKIDQKKLIEHTQSVRNCPVQVQDYVEKHLELRITVVGEHVFSCAIDSQKNVKMMDDWRNADLETINSLQSEFDLPRDIQEKCLGMMKSLGLCFGCIDMIVTPNGEYVFLEINPNGQWYWLEENLGFDISGRIADALICGQTYCGQT